MSIFGTIMSKVLGKTPASPVTSTAAPSAQTSGTTTAAPSVQASTSPSPSVDVAAVLDDLNNKATEELDWKHSIVDLMKLLSLDSSLAARKELAKELPLRWRYEQLCLDEHLASQTNHGEPCSEWRQATG